VSTYQIIVSLVMTLVFSFVWSFLIGFVGRFRTNATVGQDSDERRSEVFHTPGTAATEEAMDQ